MNGPPTLPIVVAVPAGTALPPARSSVLGVVPRSPFAAAVVGVMTAHLLHSTAQHADCLVLDEHENRQFLDVCLLPQIELLRKNGYFAFERKSARRPLNQSSEADTQHAVCERVRYIGPSAEATPSNAGDAATPSLVPASPSSSPAAAAPQASTAATTPPPPWFELDGSLGGLIVFVSMPYARTRATDAETESELARAVAEQRFADVVRRTGQRARQLFYSRVSTAMEFDRGTLTALLINSFVTARNKGIETPYSLRYAFNVACLVQGQLSPYQQLIMAPTIDEQVILSYIDFDVVAFYADVLRNDELVRSIGYTHWVLEVRRCHDDLAAIEAMFPDEIAARASAVAAGDIGNIDELADELAEIDAADRDNNDDDGERATSPPPVKMRRVSAGGAQRAAELPTLRQSDIDSVGSLLQRSLNSRLTASGLSTASGVVNRLRLPNGEQGFRRTPFRVLEPDEHEFSDRLRSNRRTKAPIVSVVDREMYRATERVVRLAPLRLVRRFMAAFACALRLVDTYLHYAIDVWNVRDYFYLHQLVEIEMSERRWLLECDDEAAAFALSERTERAIGAFIEANGRCVAEQRSPIALAGVDVDALRALVRAVVGGTVVQRRDSRIRNPLQINVGALFGTKLALHDVLDNFQTQSHLTMRQRRARASFEQCVLVEAAELDAYIAEHALVSARDRIDAINAAAPEEPITYRVLRFTPYHPKSRVTPMAIWSTLRAYGLRDGDDALLVWTPACVPPLRGNVYLALRRVAWRRIFDAALPRLVVEQRTLGRVCCRLPLMAPALARALESPDAAVVVDALAAVQALVTRAPGRLPVQWSVHDPVSLAGARRAVAALRDVASALVRRVGHDTEMGRALCAAEMVAVLARQHQDTSRHSSLFSAVQVALGSDRLFMYMQVNAAERFVGDEGPQLDATEALDSQRVRDMATLRGLLRQQLAATRNVTTAAELAAQRASALGDDNETTRSDLTRTTCRCGAESGQCARLARALLVRLDIGAPARQARGIVTIECCLCAAVRMGNYERHDYTGERKRRYAHDEIGKRAVVHRSEAEQERLDALTRRGRRSKSEPRRMHWPRCDACCARIVVASTTAAAKGLALPIYDPLVSTHQYGDARAGALTPERIIALLAHPTRRQYLYALRVGTRRHFVCKTVLPRGDGKQNNPLGDPTDADAPVSAHATRASIGKIVETTRALADVRLNSGRPELEREIAQAGGGKSNDLLALLVQLEMLALSNHKELQETGSTVPAGVFGRRLNVLSDAQLSAMRVDGLLHDGNGVLDRDRRTGASEVTSYFPLCQSVFVESVGIWQRTAASNARQTLNQRVDAVLFAGRTPRPALSLPPAMMELVLGNWYDGRAVYANDSDDIDSIVSALDVESATTFEVGRKDPVLEDEAGASGERDDDSVE